MPFYISSVVVKSVVEKEKGRYCCVVLSSCSDLAALVVSVEFVQVSSEICFAVSQLSLCHMIQAAICEHQH